MDLIKNYREDLQLIRKTWTRVWVGAIVAAMFVVPIYCPHDLIYVLTVIWIFAIGVQGQNLLIGYTGQISFGQAGFLAIGAFAFAHLSGLGLPWPITLAGAGVAAGLFGVVVGFPSLRLKGPYLAIVTMGFAIAVYQYFRFWSTLRRPHGAARREDGIHFRNVRWPIQLLFQLYFCALHLLSCRTISFRHILAGPLSLFGTMT